MPVLPKPQTRQIVDAADALGVNDPEQLLEDFVANELNWNATDRVTYFPAPDDPTTLQIAGDFTNRREKILRNYGKLPTFVVYKKPQASFYIAGLMTYLQSQNVDTTLIGRLRHYDGVRRALLRLSKGHYLEAITSVLLDTQCASSQATKGSGDQGIDAVAWTNLFKMEKCFLDGDCQINEPLPGEKVFVLASAKANLGKGVPKVINPAHIRDIIGGWIIQRSTVGVWQNQGVLMLSPAQMLISTTYRLSPESKLECRRLGVQVWSMPELVYLICKLAPSPVFDQANQYAFNSSEFKNWWKPHHIDRMLPKKTVMS